MIMFVSPTVWRQRHSNIVRPDVLRVVLLVVPRTTALLPNGRRRRRLQTSAAACLSGFSTLGQPWQGDAVVDGLRSPCASLRLNVADRQLR